MINLNAFPNFTIVRMFNQKNHTKYRKYKIELKGFLYQITVYPLGLKEKIYKNFSWFSYNTSIRCLHRIFTLLIYGKSWNKL